MKTEAIAKWLVLLLLVGGNALAQGVRWEDLRPAERELLAGQELVWVMFAPERQERIALGARRWLEMNRSERRSAEERFTLWQGLGDDRRVELRQRYEIYRNLPRTDRDRLRDVYVRFNRLPRDQRDEIRRQFRQVPPDQLQRLRDRRPAGPEGRPDGR